jgi:hypothetical protein
MSTIHAVNGGYVLSDEGSWRPGSFATRRAAELAAGKTDDELQALQDSKCGERITEEDVS